MEGRLSDFTTCFPSIFSMKTLSHVSSNEMFNVNRNFFPAFCISSIYLLLEPTVIVVSTLTFNKPWTNVTIFLAESGESVSMKGLNFFKKSCNFLQSSLSLTILEFPLPNFISAVGTKEQLDSFSMTSVTSVHNGRENTNKFLCTLLIPLHLVNPLSDLDSRMGVCLIPWLIVILPKI